MTPLQDAAVDSLGLLLVAPLRLDLPQEKGFWTDGVDFAAGRCTSKNTISGVVFLKDFFLKIMFVEQVNQGTAVFWFLKLGSFCPDEVKPFLPLS